MKKFIHSIFLIFAFALFSSGFPLREFNQDVSQDYLAVGEGFDKGHQKRQFDSKAKTPPRAYAIPLESNDILSINLESGTVEKNYPLDFRAKILAFFPNGEEICLADTASGHLVKLEIASKKIEKLISPGGIPLRLAISSNGDQAFAIYENSGDVVCLDFNKQCYYPLASFKKAPCSIALSLADNKLFVAFKGSNDLVSIDISTSTATPFLATEGSSDELKISRDGKTLYSFHAAGPHVEVIHIPTKSYHKIPYHEKTLFTSNLRGEIFIANGKKGSLYLAKERETEILAMNLITQSSKSIAQLPQQVSSIAFFPEPELHASFSVQESRAGELTLFDASTTRSEKQGAIHYHWDFGDGLMETSEAPFIEHIYEAAGHYVAEMTAVQEVEQRADPSAHEITSQDPKTLVAMSTGILEVLPSAALANDDLLAQHMPLDSVSTAKTFLSNNRYKLEEELFEPLLTSGATPTTTTLNVSPPSPTNYGTTLTLTASITPSVGPTGTVTFYDGASQIGTPQVVSGGTAILSYNALSGGTHSLFAIYSGDATYASSTSNTVTQVVNKVTPVSITLTPAPASPSVYGENVTFTSVVSASFGVPTGTVTFKDGGTTIGSGTLTQSSSTSSTASFTINSLSVGSHSITAVYSGDTNFNAITSSPPLNYVVNMATPANFLMSSVNPSTFGENVTFTSTVTAPFAFVPTGTITFKDGGTTLQVVSLTPSGSNSSQASYSINSLSGGSHSITAVYSGDSNFNSVTSNTVNQVVGKLMSTTVTILSNSQSPTEYGQPINLEAILVGSLSNPPFSPGGTVSFYAYSVSNPYPGTLLGSSTVTAVPNTNTVSTTFTTTTPFLHVGTYTFYATYSGNTNYDPASSYPSSTVSHQIVQTLTTTALAVTDNCTDGSFSSLNLTATVTSNPPGAGTPVGNVNFYDDAFTLLGTVALNGSGQATLTNVSLSVGNHDITAVYEGNSDFANSLSSVLSQTVSMDDTTTVLMSSALSIHFGNTLTLTATVAPFCSANTTTPTGTVTFLSGGTTVIGTGTLSPISPQGTAQATLTICSLYPGTYSLTAMYPGDSNFNASTSSPISQTVTGTLGTTTVITSSSENPVAVCPDTTIFTATVSSSAPSCVVPTGGTVTFTDTTTSTNLGTGSLVNGTATSPAVCFAAGGTHEITATYNPGSAPFSGSTSAPFPQCVDLYDTATSLTITYVDAETSYALLTATVSVISGTGPYPDFLTSGTVSFYDGTNLIGTVNVPANSNTTFTVSIQTPCVGCKNISAVYSGEPCSGSTPGNFDTSSDTLMVDQIPTTTVDVVGAGPYYFCQTITFTGTVSSGCLQSGCVPTGTITFFDGTVAIGTAIVNGSGVATLPVSTLSVGTHSISAIYNGDGIFDLSESTTPVSVTVVTPPTTTTLAILPEAGSVYGDTIILGATVTSPAGTPTMGSVNFSDQNGIFATVQISALGKAVYSTQLLGGGSHTFTATYNPDCCSATSECFTSSSATVSYTITPVLPRVVMTASPQTVTYGDAINLTATVTSFSVGTPTGTVTFYVGTTPLGTASLVDTIAYLTVSNYLSNANIPVGTNLVFTALYSGDANFDSTVSSQWLETINKAPVTVSIVSETPNPSFSGTTVNLTATVRSLLNIPTDSGNSPVGIPPTGTVTFVVDGTPFGAPVTLVNGIATLSISSLAVGSSNPHSIVAEYSGDANFIANNALTYTQQIELVDTITTIASSSNPSTYNVSPTFTATVASLVAGQGTPTGSITVTYGSYSASYPLSSGQAAFTIPNLQAGIDTILVSYSGNSTFNPSSGEYSQSVNPAATTTTLGLSPTSSVYGQPVTLTANVTSTQGTPTGLVTFYDGSTELGVATLSSGSAAIIIDNFPVGTDSLSAVYHGEGNFAGSTGTANIVVTKASTTTTLATSEPFAVYGYNIVFTATVTPTAPGAGIPTGSVNFFNGVTLLGSGTLDQGGVATFSTDSLGSPLGVAASPYSITATYVGDTNFNGSTTTSSLSQAIIPVSTITTASSSANPSTLGSGISILVTVNSINDHLSVPNGGTVNVYYGSNPSPIGNGTLTGGTVTIPISAANFPKGGSYPLTVAYQPSLPTNFSDSSTNFDQIVGTGSGTSSTALVSSQNPSVYGQPVTFTATVSAVSPSSPTPTGIVTFYDGTTEIGIATLSSGGIGAITVSNLSVGTHSITAVYGGDGNFGPSTSNTVSQVVNQASTATTLATSEPFAVYGYNIVFTATVTPTAPGAGMPSGTVNFFNGLTLLGTGTLDQGGVATFSTDSLGSPLGVAGSPYPIAATYVGDTNFNGSTTSSPLSQAIIPASTTTTAVSSANPSSLGNSITITATVSSINDHLSVPDGGTVNVYYGSNPSPIGAGTLTGGTATITLMATNFPKGGSYPLTVAYQGSANFSVSSTNFDQIVGTGSGTSSTALVSSQNPSVYGQPVTFTATVSAVSPSSPTPTGIVTFYDGTTEIGIATLSSAGIGAITVSNLSVGTHSITAVYGGDGNFGPSTSNTVSQVVNQASTTTTLATSEPFAVYGYNIVFTATVTPVAPGAGMPSGAVGFYNGLTLLGTGTLDQGGVATFSTDSLGSPLGVAGSPYSITAQFVPNNSNFATSTSSPLSQAIIPVSTITTASSSSNPSTLGSGITITATVASVNDHLSVPAGGSVNVYYGSNPTPIGTASYTGGTVTIPISAANFPKGGSYPLTVSYLPPSPTNFSGSSTNFDQVVGIGSGTSSTALVSSQNPSVYGQPVTFTATVSAVSPATGTPTGIVTFYDGTTEIGIASLSSGSGSITVSNLSVGTHPITAVYGGDESFGPSTSNTVSQIVNQASTATTLATSEPFAVYGQNIVFTATVSPTAPGAGMPTGTVDFYNGVTLLGSGTLDQGGVATFSTDSLVTPLGVASSPYSITATYVGDTNFSTSTSSPLSQAIIPASTTTTAVSSANPSSLGNGITITATVNSINDHLSVPDGGTVNVYSGSNLTPIGTGTLTGGTVTIPISASNFPAAGSYPLTVSYLGSPNFSPSSTNFEQLVNLGATTTTLSSSPNPSTYGQPVTFTAIVSVTAPATGTPTGIVNFIEGGQVIGTGTLSGTSPFTAAITLTDLTVGSHTITAEYVGDNNFSGSTSPAVSQQVNQAPTSTTIVLNYANPSMYGEDVTFVASTTPDPAIAAVVKDPSGTVSFYDGTISPATLLGTVPTNGIALLTTNVLSLAPLVPHNIIAVYNGDSNFTPSTSPAVQQYVTATSETFTSVTTLTSTPNPSNYGCPVTFTITVAPNVPPVPFPGPPTGIVSLYLGTEALTPMGIPLVPGTTSSQATVTIPYDSIPPLPAGSLDIIAIYSGDINYSASTTSLIQVVNPIPTTMVLASSVNPSVVSQPVTFTATVSATIDCPPVTIIVPTGTVSFYDGALPGGAYLGTSVLNASGTAVLTTDELLVGTHTITAVYNPDVNFQAVSATLQQQVNCLATITTMLTAWPNPSVLGESVAFIAGVSVSPDQYTNSETGPPVGSVIFYDTLNGVGPTPIGTVTLSNGLAILNTSSLALGTHMITIAFTGTTNFCPSALAAPGYQQVVVVPVLPANIVVTSTPNPSYFGQNVVFTSSVTDPSHRGIPTGTVTFYDGDMAIGTGLLVNGVAEISTSDLSIGDHPITAIYSGNAEYDSATSAVYVQVVLPSPYPLPPHDFFGCQVINKYLNFNEIVNILTWVPPQHDESIVRYEIYRDAKLKKLAGVVENHCPYRFEDGNRKKKKVYKYYIVSVNKEGKKSPVVSTKVIPRRHE